MDIEIVPLDLSAFAAAGLLRRNYGLLTNDSLLLSTAQALEIKAFASADRDFDRPGGITSSARVTSSPRSSSSRLKTHGQHRRREGQVVVIEKPIREALGVRPGFLRSRSCATTMWRSANELTLHITPFSIRIEAEILSDLRTPGRHGHRPGVLRPLGSSAG